MAEEIDRSPLQSGPTVGTELRENVAQGYQREGNVVIEPVKPAITGDIVEKAALSRAQALTSLANGIDKGLAPLIDNMAQGAKQRQQQSDLEAGTAAGAAAGANLGTNGAAPSSGAAASQVTRGADGTLNVVPSFTSLLGFGGDPTATYARAYGAAALAANQGTTKKDLTNIQAAHLGDPDGFLKESGDYIAERNWNLLGGEYGTKARQDAIDTQGEISRGLILKKASQDLVAGGLVIQSQIDSVSNDMSTLARGGQMNSPAFDKKQDQLQDLYAGLKENPSYTGNADDELNKNLNRFRSDHIVGQVDSAYQQGGASAAEKMVGDAIDKIPGLSDQERLQFLQEGRGRIGYNQGINKDRIDVNRAAFERMRQEGITPAASGALDNVINSAKQTGDYVTATEATAAQTALKVRPAGLSAQEMRNQTGPAAGQNPHPLAPSQPMTPENHPGEYGGAMTVGGQRFSFVSGGSGRGSSPPGDHEITGYRTDGVFAGRGGAFTVADVFDPKVGDTRRAVEIHSAAHGATAGCFGVPPDQWPAFQAECQKVMAANGGHAFLHVGPDGNAFIDGNPIGRGVSGAGTPLAPGGDYGSRVKQIESSGGATSLNLYQFQPGTWAQYGAKYGSITDPTAQQRAFDDLTAANRAAMTTGLGRAPTDGELYLAHQQGAANAIKLIQNPNARAGSISGDTAIRQNAGDPNAPASAFVQKWASNFAGARTSGTAPSSAGSGTSLTAEQMANPSIYTAYTDMVAGDLKNRKAAAENLGGSLDTAISNHYLPAPESLAQYTQLAQDIPSEEARLQRITGGAIALAERGGGGGGIGGGLGPGSVPSVGGPAYQQQVAALMGGKDYLFKMGVAAEHTKMLDSEAEFAKSHPVEYSARKGWSQQPPPINFSDPQSVAQGFQANAQITAGVARREPGVSVTAVPTSMVPEVTSAMTSADPKESMNVLSALEALPPQVRGSTLTNDSHAIGKAVVGMARSGDPIRMGAAFGVMDKELQANPLTFDSKFGEGAKAELIDWQGRRQFQTTAQIAKDLATANDPSTISAIKVREGEADKLLEAIAPKDVVAGLTDTSGILSRANPWGADYKPISDSSAGSADGLKADYDKAYRYQYGKTGEKDVSDLYARNSVATKWTPSDANGGRLTPWAPETAYPDVHGSKAYIGDQLKEFVAANGHPGAQAYLVPDNRTDTEIHGGRPPTYRVVIQAADGSGWHALTGSDGIAANRFYADPKVAQARAEENFMANRPTSQGMRTWGATPSAEPPEPPTWQGGPLFPSPPSDTSNTWQGSR